MGEYHVMWQLPKGRVNRATYSAASLQSLLKILDRTEGVSIATTDQLIVHYHQLDGGVIEVVSHDRQTGRMRCDYSPKTDVVVPINKGKNKPHIRLPAPAQRKYVIGGSGLFQAFEA